MRRREFITLLGAAAAWPVAARAALGSEASGQRDDPRVQGERRTRRIGVLMLYAENDTAGQVRATAFRQQLEKLQWEVGRNLQIDYYWGIGDADWIRSAAEQLLQRRPDVILANGGQSVPRCSRRRARRPSSSSDRPIPLPRATCKASHIPAATRPASPSWSRITAANCWGGSRKSRRASGASLC